MAGKLELQVCFSDIDSISAVWPFTKKSTAESVAEVISEIYCNLLEPDMREGDGEHICNIKH